MADSLGCTTESHTTLQSKYTPTKKEKELGTGHTVFKMDNQQGPTVEDREV